jgi:hypothetical protein
MIKTRVFSFNRVALEAFLLVLLEAKAPCFYPENTAKKK